jgi:hypothetical protein
MNTSRKDANVNLFDLKRVENCHESRTKEKKIANDELLTQQMCVGNVDDDIRNASEADAGGRASARVRSGTATGAGPK